MLRLTKAREERRWSRWELARRAGVHPADIGKIEARRLRPYPAQATRIATALGVPSEELFDTTGWPLEVEPDAR